MITEGEATPAADKAVPKTIPEVAVARSLEAIVIRWTIKDVLRKPRERAGYADYADARLMK